MIETQMVNQATKQLSMSENINKPEQTNTLDARYRFVFETAADGMFLMHDQVFTDCNLAVLKMFNCSKNEILNKSPMDFSPLLQADGQDSESKAAEKIKAALSGETQFFEWTHKRLCGDEFDAEVTLNKVELHGVDHILASVRDISARKKNEKELAQFRAHILQKNENLALLNELSQHLHATNSVKEIYTKTQQVLAGMHHIPAVSIYQVDIENNALHFIMQNNQSKPVESQHQSIPINPKFAGHALDTGELVYADNISTDTRLLAALKPAFTTQGYHSLVVIPLVYQDKKIAILNLAYRGTQTLSKENIEVLNSIGKTVSLALANAQTRSELQYIAHHDSLTDLGNRVYFHTEFTKAISEKAYSNAALYLLDLDRFKEINDTLGHFTGDTVLKKIGPRLKSCIKGHHSLVSRLGGDEFIIAVFGVNKPRQLEKIAQTIIASIRRPYEVDDMRLEIDTSMGIAMYPKDGMNSHALLRSADVAMYQAKHTGKGYAFYDQGNDVHTPKRLAMIAELGSSITSGQLFLHYQPKIDLKNNQVIGFEALARWDHPRMGQLSPAMFIPLIEMTNSIYSLTEEVLHQALAQQMQWRKDGYDYSVAVNLSARNLIDDRIVYLLEDLLSYYDTPPGMLELEITETALMHDTYRAVDYLKQLAKLGIKLSIDDFGTGYSSLAYLQKLPIDRLKLDREFVLTMLDDNQGNKIVETIVSLSNQLDLTVIAEGVEDKNTLDRLRSINCHQAQGYFIYRPDTWDNIQHWLKRKQYLQHL